MQNPPENSPPACTPPAAPAVSDRRAEPGVVGCVLLLLALCAVLFLPRIASLPLADPDEARYALVVRNMLRSGDWIVPRVAGRPYTDKPAPYFWLAAAGTVLTGDAEMGGRIVSAVFATLAVLVTFALARSLAGGRAGLLAGVLLATSPGPLIAARLYRMDMPLTAMMWAALAWFRHCQAAEAPPAGRRRQWLGFYALCAGATLIKGPIGLGLPGLVVAAQLLLSGRPRRVLELLNPLGIALYLLITAPWYLAVCLRCPQYLYEFFVVQNLVRYAGKALGERTFPAVFYVVIVLGCMMPWTVYLPGALARTFPRRWAARAADPAALFCWLAALLPLAFFMLGRTRLAVYVLPVAPPLATVTAIPMARWVASHHPDRLYRAGTTALRLAVCAMALALAGFELHFGWLDGWFAFPAGAVALAVGMMGHSLRRARRGAFFAWAAAAAVAVALFASCHTAERFYARRTMAPLGERVAAQARPDDVVCYFGKRRHSFAFYAGRTWARRFQRESSEDIRQLLALFDSPRRVFCLVENAARLRILRAGGAAVTVLAERDGYVLVTNRPAASPDKRRPATGTRPA